MHGLIIQISVRRLLSRLPVPVRVLYLYSTTVSLTYRRTTRERRSGWPAAVRPPKRSREAYTGKYGSVSSQYRYSYIQYKYLYGTSTVRFLGKGIYKYRKYGPYIRIRTQYECHNNGTSTGTSVRDFAYELVYRRAVAIVYQYIQYIS